MADIDDDSALPKVGLLERFPIGPSGCALCPPTRRDFVLKRFVWRGIILLQKVKHFPKRPIFVFPLIAAAFIFGGILESFIEAFCTAEYYMTIIISFLAMLALIAVPSYMLIQHPDQYNVTAQILFSLFLTVASTWFGFALNNKKARREVTAAWLPAAEQACKQLLTLSSTVERMKVTQAHACSAIDPLIKDGDAKMVPIRTLISLQCRESVEKLTSLRSHIENSISDWQVFIGSNCAGDECSVIDQRLQDWRTQLSEDIQKSECSGQCKPEDKTITTQAATNELP